jgi:UDP-N-acetylglucosamine acyltransferase
MAGVHETAVIDSTARLGPDVTIGPYSVIGPNVEVGAGTRVGAHVVIERDTVLGERCAVHTGAALGGDPQDLKYDGEPTRLVVGDRTVVREFVTLNRGTSASGQTTVGSDCLLMAYSHVAHDCVIGDRVILANAVNMGGHVILEEHVLIGGLTGVHQFVRVGAHAIVSGASAVRKDVPPYVKAAGNPMHLFGLNSVGLQRRGFSDPLRRTIKRLYRLFFQSNLNIGQAVETARTELEPYPEVLHFIEFVTTSERGITI